MSFGSGSLRSSILLEVLLQRVCGHALHDLGFGLSGCTLPGTRHHCRAAFSAKFPAGMLLNAHVGFILFLGALKDNESRSYAFRNRCHAGAQCP